MAGRSRVLGYGLPLVGVAALIAGATTVMRDQPSSPAETPVVMPPISPAAGGVSNATEFIGATGSVEPAGREIRVGSHMSGVVDRVLVRVGQAVDAGQELFLLDARSAQAAVAQRRADVATAEASVLELLATIPSARARVESALAQVESAKAAVERARGDLLRFEAELADRANQLRSGEAAASLDARAIAAEVLEARRFAVRAAEASVAGGLAWIAQNEASVAAAEASVLEARADLATVVENGSADGSRIAAARAAVDQARAALAVAQTELDLRTVRSPIAGSVLQVEVRAGEFASAGGMDPALLTLGAAGPLHVRVQIDEVDIPRFGPSAGAWASPRGQSDVRLELTAVGVEPMVVPKRRLSGAPSERVDTRVLEIVYALPRDAAGVYVGQQLDVYIEAGSQAGGGR